MRPTSGSQRSRCCTCYDFKRKDVRGNETTVSVADPLAEAGETETTPLVHVEAVLSDDNECDGSPHMAPATTHDNNGLIVQSSPASSSLYTDMSPAPCFPASAVPSVQAAPIGVEENNTINTATEYDNSLTPSVPSRAFAVTGGPSYGTTSHDNGIGGYGAPYVSRINCVIPTTGYYVGYYRENYVSCHSRAFLTFQPVTYPGSSGWHILGKGRDSDGPFTIEEGLLAPDGQAYWIETQGSDRTVRRVLNTGKFYFAAARYHGRWHADNGVECERYTMMFEF